MPISPQDRGTRTLSASMTWVASVGFFAFAGHWLDKKLDTSPLCLASLALLGAVGGFIHFMTAVAPGVLPWGKKQTARQKEPERRAAQSEAEPPDDQRPES